MNDKASGGSKSDEPGAGEPRKVAPKKPLLPERHMRPELRNSVDIREATFGDSNSSASEALKERIRRMQKRG